jgi:hypothetical protein
MSSQKNSDDRIERQQSQGAFLFVDVKGREQRLEKTSAWERLTRAMGLILGWQRETGK